MRTIHFVALLLVTLSAHAADNKFVNEEYDLQKVADGVYSFIAYRSEIGQRCCPE